MLTIPEIRSSSTLKKLILVSLCEIFKDICPSYKIRAWSEKENEQMAGKEVKTLKDYEETLLKQYKLYIDYLSETIRSATKLALIAEKSSSSNNKDKIETISSLAFISTRCVCQLFEKLFYFNYSNDLIEIIANQLTSKITQVKSGLWILKNTKNII